MKTSTILDAAKPVTVVDKKQKHLIVPVSREFHKRVKALAVEMGTTITGLTRAALAAYLDAV